MLRLFSPFTVSGRFALMLVLNLIASGGLSAQENNHDQTNRGHGPTLVTPADGSVVAPQFVVRIGFDRGGPRGPSEGTGIAESPPPPPPRPPMPRDANEHGPAAGTGLAPNLDRGPQRGASHFVLLVDAPALESGSAFQADANHIAFPAGSPQMTVTLPPGQHQLLLQSLDHDGEIMKRSPPEAVQVTVK